MGVPLFDFAANIGKKVFNRGEDKAAEKLKKHIEANNPGISGLDVAIDGDTAVISGSAKDQAAYEKAVLLAGNVEGVGKVEAGATVVRSAGTAMTSIVGHADRIRDLLGVIARGAQQQSLGLGEIGGTVQSLDQSTQQNAALSEETAAAAAALKDQAQSLVTEVARFKLHA
jgi:methyl-accepting chemotaxis protein